MRPKILIVDSEMSLAEQLALHLQGAGYQVITAPDGSVGLAKALTENPALVIVDAVLPVMPGLELCRHLKTVEASRHLPVILLSAKNSDQDRIRGLEVGADDYVPKPFHPREIVLRVNRSLGRNRPSVPVREKVTAGDFELDERRHEFRVNQRSLELTVIEFKLMALLMTHQGFVLERGKLLESVWGYSVSSRTIDTHVTRLRAKLGKAAEWIETVHGLGYRLKDRLQARRNGMAPPVLAETADRKEKCLVLS